MRTYTATVILTATRKATVEVPDHFTTSQIEQSFIEQGADILWGDKSPDSHHYHVNDIKEIETLTADQLAFIDAYLSAVSDAPREIVIDFLRLNGDLFYRKYGGEYYSGLADALCMWDFAVKFQKEQTA